MGYLPLFMPFSELCVSELFTQVYCLRITTLELDFLCFETLRVQSPGEKENYLEITFFSC